LQFIKDEEAEMVSPAHAAKRQPCRFTGKNEKRLADYVLAASTAGVGVLALAQPAEAKIVYTPTSKVLQYDGVLYIDLNNDGRDDFILRASSTLSGWRDINATDFNPRSHGVAATTIHGWAVRFNSGSSIGGKSPRVNFQSAARLMTSYSGIGGGGWLDAHGYLGLRIKLDGEWHYGWARLNGQRGQALLTGYAYETIANKPIKAGQTSGDSDSSPQAGRMPAPQLHSQGSLGALALGAPGLALWRREESAASTPSA
jgi:hypothetical protein